MEFLQHIWSFIVKGGPVFGLLVFSSVVCMALVLERFLALSRKKVAPRRFTRDINALVDEKKISEALTLCRASDVTIARILEVPLSTPTATKQEIQEEMELVGRRETSILERNLTLLGTMAAAGPLVGLFGTVTGMIRTFGVVGVVGVGDPIKLAGGISEALINTAGGMAVGIPALVFQHYFLARVDRYVIEMEGIAQRVLRTVKRGG